ncbi:hypothetical protein SLS58_002007 [Diplodia intermedia]|uniref:Uncharacterized protein n=1 Tax=Diplodia intermedia TaxID=856260 RepID=A0ABR3U192_9PEZI
MALEGNLIVMIAICAVLFSSYIGFQIFNAVSLFRAARRSRQEHDPELANTSTTAGNAPPQATTELEKLPPPDHFHEANASFLNPRAAPVPSVRSSTPSSTTTITTISYFTTQLATPWSPFDATAPAVRHPSPAQQHPRSYHHNHNRPCTASCYADPFALEALVAAPPPQSLPPRAALRERRLTAIDMTCTHAAPAPSSSDGSGSRIAPEDAFSIGGDDVDDDDASSDGDGSTGFIPCKFFSGAEAGEISPSPSAGPGDGGDDGGNAIAGLEDVELGEWI